MGRQWGQICPFDICARSIVTKLRQRPLSEPPDPVRCRGVTHSTPPFPASQPTYRSDRREKIGSSSRRDATFRNCGIQAPFGPPTICQMDRSDPITPFPISASAPLRLCGKTSLSPPPTLTVPFTQPSILPPRPLRPARTPAGRRCHAECRPSTGSGIQGID